MKHPLLLCAAAAVALGLATLSLTPKGQPLAAPVPRAVPAAAPDHSDEIKEAMHNLEEAQSHLDKAVERFGGHRVKALNLAHEAYLECKEALETAEHEHH